MKFSLNREAFLKPLERLADISVSNPEAEMAILANIYLSVEKNDPNSEIKDANYRLKMICADKELQMYSSIGLFSNDLEEGETTANVKKLLEIVRSLPVGTTIEISENNGSMLIKTNKTKANLLTQSPYKFPAISTYNALYEAKLDEEELATMLKLTDFSVSADNYRKFLRGIRFEFDGNTVSVYGADGHRLSLYEGKILEPISYFEENQIDNRGFILPKKTSSELRKLLALNEKSKAANKDVKVNDEITLSVGQNYISATISGITIVSKLIDELFPSIRNLIPTNCNRIISIERDYFKEVLRRALILCNPKNNAIVFEVVDNSLNILASNPQHEDFVEHVESGCECENDNFKMAFNAQFLIDVCNTLTSPKIQLAMAKSSSNLKITTIQEENADNNAANISREKNACYIISRFQL